MVKKKTPLLVEGASGQEYTRSKKPAKRHEENQVQKPIVRILRQIEEYTGLLTFFHVPNQLLRRSDLRKIFFGLGVRAGVPDIVIILKTGQVIWLELKFDGNDTSDKQDEFIGKLQSSGQIVEIIDAKNSHDAQEQLFAILAKYGLTQFKFIHPKDRE